MLETSVILIIFAFISWCSSRGDTANAFDEYRAAQDRKNTMTQLIDEKITAYKDELREPTVIFVSTISQFGLRFRTIGFLNGK
ncbi:hypothetical protein [Alkalibacterium kapii]|uniref:Uncharacterized protein n=1 Tax=Alkalibacterium kapii TaxID=426704 RepID=A0A511AUH9_9LACT|nr:hypothetical protein [Alkalibacterium kapii]GEK90751.1 hypothetical protein AKA01nite_03730 [Alkalibacterium kapii]